MNLLDVFFIGVGLSMDAFAVSICKGLKMKVIDLKQSFKSFFVFECKNTFFSTLLCQKIYANFS